MSILGGVVKERFLTDIPDEFIFARLQKILHKKLSFDLNLTAMINNHDW